MRRRKLWVSAIGALGLAGGILLGQGRPPASIGRGPALRVFSTPYYALHTDLGEADSREADLRMTRMFEEYARRTTGFATPPKEPLPFYLYRNAVDYYAAGGVPKSAGVFIAGPDGSKLMAIAGQKASDRTWHTLQHEGFHQFIYGAIRGPIPPWVNEGLAEYFGEALFTGDGFISGLIPNDRLTDIRQGIRSGNFKPFTQMMNMTAEQWGDNLAYSNYDQAWAMVHFLIEGDGGKYQKSFEQFMLFLSRGLPQVNAWDNAFGRGTMAAFEQRCGQWWMALPDHPTRSGYLRVAVATLTSFLGRAMLQKQNFADAQSFLKEFHPADLTLNRDMWLPPSLFVESSDVALHVGKWTLDKPVNQLPRLVCVDADGTKYVGTIILSASKVGRVSVEVTAPATQAATTRSRGPR